MQISVFRNMFYMKCLFCNSSEFKRAMIDLLQWRATIGCYSLKIKCYVGRKYTNNAFDEGGLYTFLRNVTITDVAILHIALFELYVASILLLCSGDIEVNPGPVCYVMCPNCEKKLVSVVIDFLRNVLDVLLAPLKMLALMY